MLSPAPLLNDLARGPEGGSGHWVHTEDGLRLRLGLWPNGSKGTVLIFPGRTEYIEKYGGAAAALAKAGYSSLAIDWRGQGLSDRLLSDRLIGHVHRFSDYQRDVQTLMAAARALDLPKPYSLGPLHGRLHCSAGSYPEIGGSSGQFLCTHVGNFIPPPRETRFGLGIIEPPISVQMGRDARARNLCGIPLTGGAL